MKDGTEGALTDELTRDHIDEVLSTRTVTTAFQPIYSLETGTVVGAEALTRIVCPPFRPPAAWFAEATRAGRGVDLEFLAVDTALRAAGRLPPNVYVSLNLSPQACLDPALTDVLLGPGRSMEGVVLELTERTAVSDYEPLVLALAELRRAGLRIAIDDAGAGFASMRHILELKPDLIKLDRSLIAGIDRDRSRRAFGAAMVSFAAETSAGLVAEGIETASQLSAASELGIGCAQGYFLGIPSVRAAEWRQWAPLPLLHTPTVRPKGARWTATEAGSTVEGYNHG